LFIGERLINVDRKGTKLVKIKDSLSQKGGEKVKCV